MKTENIADALRSANETSDNLNAALRDAIVAGDEFAAMILEIAFNDALKLRALLTRIEDAATKGARKA